MSSNFTSSYSFTSSSSSNMTSTNASGEQTTTGHRTSQQTTSDPTSGTTVHTSTQNIGEPAVQETRHYDSQGRELLEGSGGGSNGGRRIEDVSDGKQAERDAEYEERMEEEYAKREGGA
jgi:hypothetical protein